jgi:hypothetical protein
MAGDYALGEGYTRVARAGRIRLPSHFYDLEEEIDRVAELMGSA